MTARALVADALGVAEDVVDQSTALGVTPEWDSLAHMRLALAIEAQIGRPLSTDEILSIGSVEDVAALL